MSLIFKDLSFTYSPNSPFEFEALNEINAEIKDGSFTFLVGKTGCGKSTLIQHANGLLKPVSGEVLYEDFVLSSKKKKTSKNITLLRKKIGVLFQFSEKQLFEDTVLKDVMFGPLNFGFSEEEAEKLAIKNLNLVGIKKEYFDRSPFNLSGGEKRRVALAGVLASDPDVLILDEPTAGLDPNGISELMGLLKNINIQGKTIVVVCHDMNIVYEYASDVIVMDNGRIVEHKKPEELFLKDVSIYSLETPILSKLINAVSNKGLKLNVKNINDIDSFVNEVKRARSKHE